MVSLPAPPPDAGRSGMGAQLAGSGVMLAPHLGYQRVAKNSDFSYTDYSLTVSYDYQGFVFSGAVVDAQLSHDPAT